MKKGLKIAGVVFLFFGFAVLLNSGLFLTGLVVTESMDTALNDLNRIFDYVGAILVLVGGALIVLANQYQ